jgi:hypothetical protein
MSKLADVLLQVGITWFGISYPIPEIFRSVCFFQTESTVAPTKSTLSWSSEFPSWSGNLQ